MKLQFSAQKNLEHSGLFSKLVLWRYRAFWVLHTTLALQSSQFMSLERSYLKAFLSSKFHLYRSISYMPVPSDPTILGFRLFCLQCGEIEYIEFNSGGNEQFKLENLQVKVNSDDEELQMKIFVANYEFQMGSKPTAFYPEHDQTIDYVIILHLSDRTIVNQSDELKLKIFNENDFVELLIKNLIPCGNDFYKIRCESKKIGVIEGIQFLDNNPVDHLPEWHVTDVQIKTNNYRNHFPYCLLIARSLASDWLKKRLFDWLK